MKISELTRPDWTIDCPCTTIGGAVGLPFSECEHCGGAGWLTYTTVATMAQTEWTNDDGVLRPIAGRYVCGTGKLYGYTRETLKQTVIDNGGLFQNSVTKKTDILVSGHYNTSASKTAKARTVGADVLTEAEFLKLVL